MKQIAVISCLVLLLILTEAAHGGGRYNALKFADNMGGNFMFKPDMKPVQHEITVCSWVKKQRSGGSPVWFSYATIEDDNVIAISDDGYYNILFHSSFSLRDRVTIKLGTWNHYCLSWSSASSAQKVYYNGSLTGSRAVHANTLGIGQDGILMLGNDQDTYGGGITMGEVFGGELYKLNVFSKELNGTEIEAMANGGLCSRVEETQYDGWRHITWEDILLRPRDGNVTEVDTGCQEDTSGSHWDVLYQNGFYNNVLTRELLEELTSRWHILENFLGANVTDGFIQHFKLYHKEFTSDGGSSWDVLYDKPFYNNVLTRELLDELNNKSRWNMLENFLGSIVTDGLIQHFKSYHEEI